MKAQKVVSVILALTLMMSMVPAAFAVELENPNDIFSEEYFAYVAKEDGNPYGEIQKSYCTLAPECCCDIVWM